MQMPLFVEESPVDYQALQRCLRAEVVSVDIETQTRWNGVGPRHDFGLSYCADITVIALAWREGDQIVSTAISEPYAADVREILATLFMSNALFVAHNAVFDFRQLSKFTNSHVPQRIWDTFAMARLLHPAVSMSYGLLSVATALGVAFPERQAAMKLSRAKLHTLPLETALEYAQDDARLTLEIYEKQRAIPVDETLIDWECRASREYCRMAAEGIRLNTDYVRQRLVEFRQQRDEIAVRLRADGLYNPGSGKARAEYLYQNKGIPLPEFEPDSWYFTRAGRKRLAQMQRPKVQLSDLSTGSGVVESYMEEGSPYASQLKDLAAYLDVDWLVSTLEALLEHAALDGRLHSLVAVGTESGRRASSNPQMQNWKMPAMAGVAIGDEGFTLVEIDYSNAENVMAAFISGDSNLSAACVSEDFHSEMAAEYFGEAWEKTASDPVARKHMRTMSKKITYGTAYGMGAKRLAQSINVTVNEAHQIMQAKDAAFAAVTRMKRAAEQEVEQTHQLILWTGRPVSVPVPFVAWNYLCQGGVSELLKRAIVMISEAFRERGWRSRVALDIHDALVLEIAHAEWDEALGVASHIMSNVTPENMNNRTDPPIQFVAKPKVSENRNKWGLLQWHPDEADEKVSV